MKRLFWVLFYCWQVSYMSAQSSGGITDSVFRISEITVSSGRLSNFAIGNKVRTLDSSLLGAYGSSYMTGVLSAYSQVQINSYGLGEGNASLRGTGSNHTAVLWNGFNLQDLLNGGVDFSLLPVSFFDDVKIQYGGCSALFGSGAIGGVIHLNNNTDFGKGVTSSVRTGYGSYDNIFGGFNMGYSNDVYSGSAHIFYNSAQNNFKYRNVVEFNSPLETLKNAEKEQYGILVGNAFKTGKQSKLESFFWFQNNDNNIPPTMTMPISTSSQNDRFYRSTLSWKTSGTNSDFTLRTGFSDYFMTYDTSAFQSVQSSTEAEYIIRLSARHALDFGANYTYEKGISGSLIANPQRNRFSLFSSYRFTNLSSKWKIVSSFRDELINQNFTPLTFSLASEYSLTGSFMVRGTVTKNYRVPTFNDLYWAGLGNPNLKCESGFNQEFGFRYTKGTEKAGFHFDFSAFNNMVSNWIQWFPHADDLGKWKPENISQVWARGLENELTASFYLKRFFIKASASYSYTRSTKNKAEYAGDPTVGKQLIYVPLHKGLFTLSMMYRGLNLCYGQSYAGKRYSDPENTGYYAVNPYTIGNLSISKNFVYFHNKISVSLQVNNLWNTNYQVMLYYPMPLRNYQLNILLNIK